MPLAGLDESTLTLSLAIRAVYRSGAALSRPGQGDPRGLGPMSMILTLEAESSEGAIGGLGFKFWEWIDGLFNV